MFTVLTVLWLVLAARPIATAHHSFCAPPDPNKPFSFSGKVARIEWANPHVWLYVDIKDAKGAVQQWAFHAAPLHLLIQGGWTRTSLNVGDEVMVRGLLPKADSLPKRGGLGELIFKGTTLYKGEARLC
jgi:hypothetical protein